MANGAIAAISDAEKHNINVFELARHATATPNARTGVVGTAFDFFAFSRYIPVGADLDSRVEAIADTCDELRRRFPELSAIPCEVHEFGIQPWAGSQDFVSREPGPWGAAHTLHSLIGYFERGFAGVWHWSLFSKVRGDDGVLRYLFNGQAWVYSVLDHMVGGAPFTAKGEPSSPEAQVQYRGIGSALAGRTIFLLSAYASDAAAAATEDVEFRLPAHAFAGKTHLRWAVLDRSTCPHRLARDELSKAGPQGYLQQDYVDRPNRLGSVSEMATQDGRRLIAQHWNTYTDAWRQSLTLASIPADAGRITFEGEEAVLKVRVASPSIVAVVAQ